MKKIKILSLITACTLVIGLFAGCGSTNSGDADTKSGKTKITFLNSKGEIQTQLEDAAVKFSEENSDIELEVIPCATGSSPFEAVSSMYASGNAPTISMLDPGDVAKFQEKLLDMSSQDFVKDSIDKSLDMVTTDGEEVIGFPFAVEGYGLIYNKKVLDSALGSEFDPSTIKTRDDLKALFAKVSDSGVTPMVLSPLDWSLAAHFLPISYADQGSTSADVAKFIDSLKAGNEDLINNSAFNGLMDTFDMFKANNIDKDDPMSGTYDEAPEVLGKGEVGFWFMGNWAWSPISEFDTADEEYGFLPIPISNNAEDYGNTQIPVGVTKYLVLDKDQSSEEEQAAAEKFLNWLVYDEAGQDVLVNKCNLIPAFSNITIEPSDPLAKSIKSYISDGKTLQFMTNLPADHWSEIGASMQKYLAGESDRAGLVEEIEYYWENVEN
ncbi:MAG: ABC transporter substrate-binding protein [Clostridiaceae bacterium]